MSLKAASPAEHSHCLGVLLPEATCDQGVWSQGLPWPWPVLRPHWGIGL